MVRPHAKYLARREQEVSAESTAGTALSPHSSSFSVAGWLGAGHPPSITGPCVVRMGDTQESSWPIRGPVTFMEIPLDTQGSSNPRLRTGLLI